MALATSSMYNGQHKVIGSDLQKPYPLGERETLRPRW